MSPKVVPLRYMPCAEFEGAIHAFVDSEASDSDSRNLLVHLELCDRCRDSVEAVRQQVRAHRETLEIESLAAAFDQKTFFSRLTGRLLAENLESLAGFLYELGKAYFVAGNDSRLRVFLHRKASAIERTRAAGRRLVRDSEAVAARTVPAKRGSRDALKRSANLLRDRRVGGRGRIGERTGRSALDNARRYLEECLILAPGHAAARLYLGVWFVRVDRPDEAIQEFRRVLALPRLDRTLRAMALQALGNAYGYRRDYERAVATFEELLETGVVAEDPRFFTVLVGLAMFEAKRRRFSRSQEVFGRLVRDFPQKIAEARGVLAEATAFRSVLQQNRAFQDELVTRYPTLFAG